MPEALDVAVKHGRGTFTLDAAFRIERWPAVLFGPSGAGKSTLLRFIAGLDRAEPCRISLGNRRLGGPCDLVQMVAQRTALFPHLSVARNVAFGLTKLPATEREARVRAVLALLGAEPLAERMPARLSGGERQRVAIARALAPRPKLLLLDEAFAGLDSGAKQDILGRLTAALHEHDIAALYVTHEVADAFALDADVVVMAEGRIVAQGRAEQVLAVERERLLSTLGHAVTPGHG